MKIHVLPGDALTENFRKTNIEGEIVVCRECLVEGDVQAETTEDFWQTRARFIEKSYGEKREKYLQNVRAEFEKLKELSEQGAEINLWFEHELFCQVNYWFTLYFLRNGAAKIFRVAPVIKNDDDIWKGFGCLSAADLEECYAGRVGFSADDAGLGADLWTAYQNKDYKTLESLSETQSPCFPYLKEVCRAAIEKPARTREVLKNIIAGGKTDFAEIFPEFSRRAGVYGFGDAQVKRILAEI